MKKLNDVLVVLDFLTQEEISEIIAKTNSFDIDSNELIKINIDLKQPLRFNVIKKINTFNKTSKQFQIALNINLDYLDKTILNLYIFEFLKHHDAKLLISVWKVIEFDLENDILKIKYHNDLHLKEWNSLKENLLSFFNNYLNIKISDINFIFDNDFLEHQKNIAKLDEQAFLDYQKKLDSISETKTKQINYYKGNLNDEIVAIKDLCLNDKNKVIFGTIFNIRVIKLKNNMNIVSYYITDNDSSLVVKQFLGNDQLDQIKINDQVKMLIDVETITYDSREYLSGKLKKYQIVPIEEVNPEEELTEHRVEFSVHTKMSSYDGLINLEDLKKKLKLLNHTHFAITDRYNIQNYPDVAKTFKNSGITPIYGVELEKLDEQILGILNPIDKSINDVEYVIFDLETTGLNPEFDDIIEFGAVVLKNNQIVDRKQFFIKPNVPLLPKISQITNIYESDLANACSQEEGLKTILDFIQDKVLIAHNGINFDFNFLNTKLVQHNFSELKNCLIDTMVISRSINPDFKSHSLEMLTKKFKIPYDASQAHRADYDANLLSQVWINFIDKLNEQECTNITKINDFIQSPKLRQNTRGEFIVAYAKNQEGIKNIYELVSNSHSLNFFGRPTITWNEINKFRQNLLVTNLCIESDILNIALTKPQKYLVDAMQKYDFITICGPSGFHHEIQDGNITLENYQLIVKKIIEAANIANKKIVATSNAYYLEEYEKQFHNLYVVMPTLNKRPHRFFKFGTGPISFLKNTLEMEHEFKFLGDKKLIDEINFKNVNEIIECIDKDISPIKDKLYPPKIEGVDEKIKEKVYENAHKFYGEKLPEIVESRIQKELNSIITHGYAVVYWISHLLVNESINDGYVVGSRGSVGSSLVATFLDITDVNPLPPHYLCRKCQYSNFDVDSNVEDGYDLPIIKCPQCNCDMQGEGHNILFEVFLGFYGDKVPDIDLNFSGNYQNKAHNFIKKMFGNEKTFRAGTISTIAEKTSYANTKGYFLEINKEMNPAEVERYATKCVDVKRTTGQHPGGIIVVPNNMSIYDFTPYNYPADDTSQDWFTTHFAFEHIHDNLLKFDILGHDNPTILRMLKDLTGVDEKEIPHYDLSTLGLFSSINNLGVTSHQVLNETTGAISIPEFGTKFVREMLNDTQPQSFADLIRISGLSHGTDVWLGNAKELIKSGMELNQIIGCRDDIMNYLISHGIESKLAFNIMEDVRKGKQIKPDYIPTLKENNIPDWYIESCNKIKYMFPKAHATAYVMHAWKFAWYKLNFPLEYYSSYFSIRTSVFNIEVVCGGIDTIQSEYSRIQERIKNKLDVSVKEKDLLPIYEIAIEMLARGFSIKMIDINKSDASDFIVDKENKSLICPFKVLDGLGDSVAESIIYARNEQMFTSKEDFIKRTKVSKQHIELMMKLGIISNLNETDQIGLFEI